MTWEEAVKYARSLSEYKELIEKAYLEEDLTLNVERFEKSEEFEETLKLFRQYAPNAKKILDIGAGNGIASIAFARQGFQVYATEPDVSQTVGSNAIRELKEFYKLSNIDIFESTCEEMEFDDEYFDIVYARQCMHHAHNLEMFVKQASRVLKKGGMFITVRDHVIFSEEDKQWFLDNHPLQKFYGGENAFTPAEYKSAMQNAGLKIISELKHFDTIINYFPMSRNQVENYYENQLYEREKVLTKKIGKIGKLPIVKKLYHLYLNKKTGTIQALDETNVPGRMYSYICIKS